MYTNRYTPLDNVFQIPKADFNKHEQRVLKLHADAEKAISSGKAISYSDECERLTDIQAKKITDLEKLYGRYLVADDMGYKDIANAFLKKYRFMTQTRGDKISNIFDDL
jgi:hypothetical protein